MISLFYYSAKIHLIFVFAQNYDALISAVWKLELSHSIISLCSVSAKNDYFWFKFGGTRVATTQKCGHFWDLEKHEGLEITKIGFKYNGYYSSGKSFITPNSPIQPKLFIRQKFRCAL